VGGEESPPLSLQEVSPDLLRHNIPAVMLGSCFAFVGVASCSIAAIRRRAEARILIWFGLFIGLYGCRMLAEQVILLNLAPGSWWPEGVVTSVNYLLILPALLFWVELSRGWLARFFLSLFFFGSLAAILGLTFAMAGIHQFVLLRMNLVLTVGSMLTLGVILTFPRLTRGQLLLKTGILKFVVPAMALLAIGINLLWLIHVPPPAYFEPVAFMAWVFALGYEAASRSFANERRLVAIDSELEMARQIQTAILPRGVAAVDGLEISLCYKPMSAVAGDFYQFVQRDDQRIGFLVADVTGHGVPAALIASMIKVAMQSVQEVADSPSDLLAGLNRILTAESGGRLTSAAYLWIDVEQRIARYSAAGHPPLIHWKSCQRTLQRIESNGLLFGIASSCTYPTCEFAIEAGDRFLLYTDGLVEPEDSAGEAFGDRELERTLTLHPNGSVPDLSSEILEALKRWSASRVPQQDDITLLIIGIR
jgi:sigma-B regulation protein RsbU (phosphoserine phosphatase)